MICVTRKLTDYKTYRKKGSLGLPRDGLRIEGTKKHLVFTEDPKKDPIINDPKEDLTLEDHKEDTDTEFTDNTKEDPVTNDQRQ